MRRRGFTLVELLVVLSIVALLTSLVAPRYLASLDRAREQALATSLQTMREAIDRFAADRQRFPHSLEELVTNRYLRSLPEDPITGRRDTWQAVAPPSDSAIAGAVADVRSGAAGVGSNGTRFADW